MLYFSTILRLLSTLHRSFVSQEVKSPVCCAFLSAQVNDFQLTNKSPIVELGRKKEQDE